MTNPLFAPVRGFRFGGVHAGIKAQGLDLGAIVGDVIYGAAGVFTQNLVCAAPVTLAKGAVSAGQLRATLVNSGNANAATGEVGLADAKSTLEAFAAAYGDELIAADVAPCSTGVIGVRLPVETMNAAMPTLAKDLNAEGAKRFAEAILTTDRGIKAARRNFVHEGQERSVLAIAKGAGMIHPNMATTLAFVVSDSPCQTVEHSFQQALREATDRTFNRITVDGDTSTNDTILAMSSAGGAAPTAFFAALRDVLGEVAEMIVADGEGAEHVAEVIVSGAQSETDALTVARTVATSNLVKTAMFGKDPNWGRIAGAAGRAGVAFDPNALTVAVNDVLLFADGVSRVTLAVEEAAAKVMALPKYEIRVSIGEGDASASYLTCDLGHGYVSVNADYRS
ncbi:MAG: bifunctional glutamate N-acetyltransferase/amino-acid acetyltransferase ArgJ [Myxococcota bacterium]